MTLFDDELKHKIESKKDRAKEDYGLFYALIYENEVRFVKSRDFLENCFSKIGENQTSIKNELKNNPNGAIKTINELIVGAYLTNLGYEVEYDREINDQRPDWWVRDSDGNDLFFLDVRTQETNWTSKTSLHPKIETKNDVDKKVTKYKEIIEKNNIPFLVALVSEGMAGIEMSEMAMDSQYGYKTKIEDDWYGLERKADAQNESLEHDQIQIDKYIYRKIEKNILDGIFYKEHLSGILDFKVDAFADYKVSLTLNPNAKFKIPAEVFPRTEVIIDSVVKVKP